MADMEAVVNQLNECAEKRDFVGAFKLVREHQSELSKRMQLAGVKDALKKTTEDRLLLSFIDCVFGIPDVPFDKALVALERLVSFSIGSRVLNSTWGLGEIKRLDYFYKRITVDFEKKRGHQFTYIAAIDMLVAAPENHILVIRKGDPARVETMLREHPGEFVKEMLRSYGDMPLVKLEDLSVQNGFVKAVNWKKFWEGAKTELRADKLVVIPVKRTDSLQLKESVEDYGDRWLTAFSSETDPKLILAAVNEYVDQKKFAVATDEIKAKIGDRLAFAITAARKVDDALYARLASLIVALGFTKPDAAEMREYLWERKRFVKAAAALPAREVGKMIKFLAVDDAAKAKLASFIPDFCFTAVSEVVEQFKENAECRKIIGDFMRQPKAPATLTTLIVGKIESFKAMTELPSLITMLTHAIALGEGRQNGETLKMQNLVRRLFADVKWLQKIFDLLTAEDKVLFFERFQASIAWDPSTHHTIVVRMIRIVPELESHLVKVEKKKEYARETSYRSFALRKQEYLKLINEDMPKNVHDIEVARGYGDLRENFEYQAAKDEQRALMQKQSIMQDELEKVKPSDFADATTDEVMPGVTVVVETAEGEKTYSILGEWDNDLEQGIISSKTRLAQNLLSKKAGDSFELPGNEGQVAFGKVKEIKALSNEIREWMKLPAGLQI